MTMSAGPERPPPRSPGRGNRHVLAPVSELAPGSSKRFRVKGRDIALFNVKGEFFALLDRCPHEGASLCRGRIIGLVESDGPGQYRVSRHGELVRCPWHGWEFDIRTGQSWCRSEQYLYENLSSHRRTGGAARQGALRG
jgi:nitrite reductase/ring-hydroxylating ferredoxin subunit